MSLSIRGVRELRSSLKALKTRLPVEGRNVILAATHEAATVTRSQIQAFNVRKRVEVTETAEGAVLRVVQEAPRRGVFLAAMIPGVESLPIEETAVESVSTSLEKYLRGWVV